MTDRSRGLAVVTAAGAMFCVALILLALQIRAGRDPAIGAGAQAAAPPRQVIVRRIIVRRIVEDEAAPARVTVARAPAPAAPVVSRGS